MTRYHVIFAAFLFQALLYGQQPFVSPGVNNGRVCGTAAPHAAWDEWFNGKVDEFRQISAQGRGQATTYTIPVIVHVIHSGQAVGTYPNLSQAQINSQFSSLNADFAGNGFNVEFVPPPFAGLVANCSISFCPALIDPDGNLLTEPGINRINHVTKGWASPTGPTNTSAFQTYFDNDIKPNTIWDPAQYLNVWISDRHASTQLLGYATFPANSNLAGLGNTFLGSAISDGIWVWSMSFGTVGTLAQEYDKGRTATHELGHWLGLRHIWGDANCGNDFCNDTPQQQNMNEFCPSWPKISCNNGPNGDMFMNFMDYPYDACLFMFTPDQRTRMLTALTFATYRKDLTASSATLCSLPPAPVAAFDLESDNCIHSDVIMSNLTQGLLNPTFLWSFTPSAGVSFNPSSTAANPTINITIPGQYAISLTASTAGGSDTVTDLLNVIDCGNPSGLSGQTLSEFSIMPNPASDMIRVTAAQGHQNARVIIHNCLGQQVYDEVHRFNGGSVKIDVKALPSGVYSVSVVTQGSGAVKRLVVSR